MILRWFSAYEADIDTGRIQGNITESEQEYENEIKKIRWYGLLGQVTLQDIVF